LPNLPLPGHPVVTAVRPAVTEALDEFLLGSGLSTPDSILEEREPLAALEAKKRGPVARLKDFLRPYVLSARLRLPRGGEMPSWERTFALLRRHGLAPTTVFDIGVAYGTYELYRAFPRAHYHLVDPTPESLLHMRQLARRLDCDIHPVALGDREGEATLE